MACLQERLSLLVRTSGKSINAISKECGISSSRLSDYCNPGKADKDIRGDNLTILAEYFNVTTDYLLGLSDVYTKTNGRHSKMHESCLPDYNRRLAEILRAGCLDLAERAEEIVGAVDLHQELRVTIVIGSKSGEITWPSVEIEHRVISRPMNEAFKQST